MLVASSIRLARRGHSTARLVVLALGLLFVSPALWLAYWLLEDIVPARRRLGLQREPQRRAARAAGSGPRRRPRARRGVPLPGKPAHLHPAACRQAVVGQPPPEEREWYVNVYASWR